MDLTKSRRSVGLISSAVCLVAGLGLTSCGSSRDQAAGTPGAGAPTPTRSSAAVAGSTPTGAVTSKPGGAAAAATPSTSQKLPKGASTAVPKDPMAPASIAPVVRSGKKASLRVKATGGARKFTQQLDYTDGVALKVTRITQGKVSGQGPGVFPGRAVTDFHVTLENGTKRTLPLDMVVVTVTYGSPARVAHRVYDNNSADFGGPVKPGAASRAVYGFSVPAADRGHVTMTVDLDGVHQLAVFTGGVK